MQTFNQTYAGAGSASFAVPGRYFRLMKTTTPVDVTLYRMGQAVYEATQVEAGFYSVPKDGFDRVEIDSGGAQAIQIAISDGFGGYDRSVGTVSISGTPAVTISGNPAVLSKNGATIATGSVVSVGTAAVVAAAATANSKALFFMADAANTAPIYLGSSGVTVANGVIKLNPGDIYIEDRCAEAAWYAISSAASQNMRFMRGS